MNIAVQTLYKGRFQTNEEVLEDIDRSKKALALNRAFEASSVNEIDLNTIISLRLVSHVVSRSCSQLIGVVLCLEESLTEFGLRFIFAKTNFLPTIVRLNVSNLASFFDILLRNDYLGVINLIDRCEVNMRGMIEADYNMLSFRWGFIEEYKLDYTGFVFEEYFELNVLCIIHKVFGSTRRYVRKFEIIGDLDLPKLVSSELNEKGNYYDVEVDIRSYGGKSEVKSLCIEKTRGCSGYRGYSEYWHLTFKNEESKEILAQSRLLLGAILIKSLVAPLPIKSENKEDASLKSSDQQSNSVSFINLPENPPEWKPGFPRQLKRL